MPGAVKRGFKVLLAALGKSISISFLRRFDIEAEYFEVSIKGKGGFQLMHLHDSKTGTLSIGECLVAIRIKLVVNKGCPDLRSSSKYIAARE